MITDIKDLKALFKLCRAQGILEFKMNDIQIKFGDLPEKYQQSEAIEQQEDLSDEDLIFYSSDRGQEALDKKVGMR